MPAAASRDLTITALAELARWRSLGVAVFTGPQFSRASYVDGWPTMAPPDSWALAEREIRRTRGAVNLHVRAGNGHGIIDFDGLGGGRPKLSLYQFLADMGLRIETRGWGVVRTGSGKYHLHLPTNVELAPDVATIYGAEVFTARHLAAVPPSLHACGGRYVWLQEPGQ